MAEREAASGWHALGTLLCLASAISGIPVGIFEDVGLGVAITLMSLAFLSVICGDIEANLRKGLR